jgi:hypothetical protein
MSSGSSKTLLSKSTRKSIEPTVQFKSKKKAKAISKAKEVPIKRDYTWDSSSEVDI